MHGSARTHGPPITTLEELQQELLAFNKQFRLPAGDMPTLGQLAGCGEERIAAVSGPAEPPWSGAKRWV
jgi:hypothetical protein